LARLAAVFHYPFRCDIQVQLLLATVTNGTTAVFPSLAWVSMKTSSLCCLGSYCIFKKGECPSDFSAGSIYWDDAASLWGPTAQTHSGM